MSHEFSYEKGGAGSRREKSGKILSLKDMIPGRHRINTKEEMKAI